MTWALFLKQKEQETESLFNSYHSPSSFRSFSSCCDTSSWPSSSSYFLPSFTIICTNLGFTRLLPWSSRRAWSPLWMPVLTVIIQLTWTMLGRRENSLTQALSLNPKYSHKVYTDLLQTKFPYTPLQEMIPLIDLAAKSQTKNLGFQPPSSLPSRLLISVMEALRSCLISSLLFKPKP